MAPQTICTVSYNASNQELQNLRNASAKTQGAPRQNFGWATARPAHPLPPPLLEGRRNSQTYHSHSDTWVSLSGRPERHLGTPVSGFRGDHRARPITLGHFGQLSTAPSTPVWITPADARSAPSTEGSTVGDGLLQSPADRHLSRQPDIYASRRRHYRPPADCICGIGGEVQGHGIHQWPCYHGP